MFERLTLPVYNLPTQIKLFFGFGVVLLLTASIAFTGYQNLNVVSREYHHLRLLDSMVIRMASARIAEKNYVLRQHPRYLSQQESMLEGLRGE